MQAYKLKGTIDSAGNLIVAESVNMPPGDVEIILLQTVDKVASSTVPVTELQPETPKRKFESQVKAFQGLFNENTPSQVDDSQVTQPKRTVECPIPILKEWLEKTEPAPADFDIEQARWERLKEKYL